MGTHQFVVYNGIVPLLISGKVYRYMEKKSIPHLMKTLEQLFTTGGLQHLVGKAKTIEKLDNAVKALLDTKLAAHISVRNVENNTLKLAADDATWATQMHYQAPALLSALNKQFELQLRKIECRVRL